MRSPFMALYGEEYFRQQWSNWVDAYQAYYDKRSGKSQRSYGEGEDLNQWLIQPLVKLLL